MLLEILYKLETIFLFQTLVQCEWIVVGGCIPHMASNQSALVDTWLLDFVELIIKVTAIMITSWAYGVVHHNKFYRYIKHLFK